MRRQFSLAAAIAIAATLAACSGSKAPNQENQENQPQNQEAAAQQPAEEQNSQPQEKNDAVEQLVKDFDCGQCPFSIKAGNDSKSYHFRNASQLYSWSYSEQNTDGWYYFNDRLISKDGKWAIGPEVDDFSSCCQYEAQPYDGPTMSEEDLAKPQIGVVYQKQSFVPMFLTRVQAKGSKDVAEIPMYQLYGFQGEFAPEEAIQFFLNSVRFSEQFPIDNASIYVFPHEAGAANEDVLSDDMKANALHSIIYQEPESEGMPNFEMLAPELPEGSSEALFDVIFTYKDVVAQYFIIKVAKAE